MFANIGFAEMKMIEKKSLNPEEGSYYYMATICIDGYKFALTGIKTSRSMVQAFEERDGKSLPAKC